MSPDRMTVLELLSKAEAELSAAAKAMFLAEDELRPCGPRYSGLTENADELRLRVEDVRRVVRNLAGEVRATIPIEDVRAA